LKRKIFILSVAGAAFLAGLLFYKQVRQILAQPVTAWTKDQSADCGVVLTGGPGRVREGFDLLAQGRVRKLIISGVYPKAELREIFPQWPYYGPISEDDVVLEKRSNTTYGNAQQSLPLVEALRCRDVILITSTLHMHRSYRIFRAVFPAEIPVLQRAIVTGRLKPEVIDVTIETVKSLFYNLWAY
jgi:uncharacterized SAM-binding protein YcdF (DUF218 family)